MIRAPLRQGLNRLRDRAEAVLQREGANAETCHSLPGAADDGRQRRDETLSELHYYSQLMFTSCGWFFNDISGLEPVQNLFYARRVVELLEGRFGERAEKELLKTLRSAGSNIPAEGHGAAKVNLLDVRRGEGREVVVRPHACGADAA